MKNIQSAIFGFLVMLSLLSFKAINPSDTDNKSIIVLKLRYNSHGLSGYGGTLKIKNLDTKETFESKAKKGFNPFVVIADIPDGNYVVEDLKIISGPNILTVRNKTLFDTIAINGSKIYYLGNYMTKKVPPLMKLNFEIMNTKQDEEEAIYKQVKKKSDAWIKCSIDYSLHLFKNNTTKIEI